MTVVAIVMLGVTGVLSAALWWLVNPRRHTISPTTAIAALAIPSVVLAAAALFALSGDRTSDVERALGVVFGTISAVTGGGVVATCVLRLADRFALRRAGRRTDARVGPVPPPPPPPAADDGAPVATESATGGPAAGGPAAGGWATGGSTAHESTARSSVDESTAAADPGSTGGMSVTPGSISPTGVTTTTSSGPLPPPPPDGSTVSDPDTLRGGAWIGALERLAIVATLLTRWPEGLAVLLAVKGLGRYPELRRPAAAERFIIGTLASALWAIACVGVVAALGG